MNSSLADDLQMTPENSDDDMEDTKFSCKYFSVYFGSVFLNDFQSWLQNISFREQLY